MQISRDQTIAGVPAVRLRDFFRNNDRFTSEEVCTYLDLPDAAAAAFLAEVETLGLVTKDRDIYDLSVAGNALAHARTRTVTRATAERALTGLLRRAEEVNKGAFAFSVARIAVFGSFLSDKDRLSDLDVAVDLSRKGANAAEYEELHRRRIKEARKAGRTFALFIDREFWPRDEVLLKLKNRSPVISIHEFEEIIRLATPHRIVFGSCADSEMRDLPPSGQQA